MRARGPGNCLGVRLGTRTRLPILSISEARHAVSTDFIILAERSRGGSQTAPARGRLKRCGVVEVGCLAAVRALVGREFRCFAGEKHDM